MLRTADLVLLLHRADAYRQRMPLAGEAELTLAKHRRGLTGRLVIAHQGHRGRFVDVPDGPRFSAHGAEETIEDGVADTHPGGRLTSRPDAVVRSEDTHGAAGVAEGPTTPLLGMPPRAVTVSHN
ncbi:hypothetical protein HCN52_03875 [Streptomyces bohaiensis]|uniref:SF4 helicase domain-containing protein n=1 Tax=Streptomyces bohaiensis TaxID=1431344 RepID=A0ABX1C4E9_9ACTN|nr:hypothetical protein [Streptomyces bohaiensis]